MHCFKYEQALLHNYYGNNGCGVSRAGIQNLIDFCPKNSLIYFDSDVESPNVSLF